MWATHWWKPVLFVIIAGHLTNVCVTLFLHRAQTHRGRDVQQAGRASDAAVAVALDVDRDEGVGGLPPEASRVRRSRGRSALAR